MVNPHNTQNTGMAFQSLPLKDALTSTHSPFPLLPILGSLYSTFSNCTLYPTSRTCSKRSPSNARTAW